MNTDQPDRDNFEGRLLGELRGMVAEQPATDPERPPRARRARSRRRLVVAGSVAGVAAVAAGVGVPFLSRGTTPAYAVSANDDGTVTVEINSLSDAAGLQSKLRDAGVSAVVQYLPQGKACKQPWPAVPPASDAAPGPGEGGVMRGGVEHLASGATRFTISRNLPADTTLVITTQDAGGAGPAAPDGVTAIGVMMARGAIQPCTVVDAPPGSPPFGPPPAAGATVVTQTGADGQSGLQTSTP